MTEQNDMDAELDRIVEAIEDSRYDQLTMYDGLAPVYDFLFADAYDYGIHAEYVRRAAPDDGPFEYLCAACGTGGLPAVVRTEVPDAETTGVDVSEAMLSVAREKVGPAADVSFRCVDVFDVEGTFDVVSAFNLLPHFDPEELSAFFEHVESLLAPGGGLVLDYKSPAENPDGAHDTWRRESERYAVTSRFITLHETTESFYAVSYEFEDTGTGESHTVGELMEIHFQTPAEVERALRAAGFDRVDVHRDLGNQSGIVEAHTRG